jgi:transposase-like protein
MAQLSSLRADCPSCGTVEIAIDDANLVLGFDSPGAEHVLRYTCPSCRVERTEATNERATRLLMAAGIGLVGSPAGAPASPEGPNSRSAG